MVERKPELWEEDWTKQYKTKRRRLRCPTLHYLGLVLTVPGVFYTVAGLFNAQFSYMVVRPGEGPVWVTVAVGVALLVVGILMFLFIEE